MNPDIDQIVDGITIQLKGNARAIAERWASAVQQNARNQARGEYNQLAATWRAELADARVDAQMLRQRAESAEYELKTVHQWLISNGLYEQYEQETEVEGEDE